MTTQEPAGDMAETRADLELRWHKVECWFGQACKAETPFAHGYLMGKARTEFQSLRHAIDAALECSTKQNEK